MEKCSVLKCTLDADLETITDIAWSQIFEWFEM